MPHLSLKSPFGDLTVFEEDSALIAIEWGKAPASKKTSLLLEAQNQLEAYFDGRLKTFDLPLAPNGTPFLKRVWKHMRTIPYGKTETYGDVAKRLQSGPRAVGMACGRNPLPIVVPCHRIVGAGGGLTGYTGGGGIETKRTLLRHERVTVVGSPLLINGDSDNHVNQP
ncbi:MAG: methylated-DNA--[protein]-cysteine S-methyltransferase [Rhodospirillales bacterium]